MSFRSSYQAGLPLFDCGTMSSQGSTFEHWKAGLTMPAISGPGSELSGPFGTRHKDGWLMMKKEQRRNPRFECKGVASVKTEPGAAPAPAKIVNLSLDGCLIVLQEPHGLSQDTIVELTFTVNDQPFRVWGRVRAIRSDTTVGFEFPLLSERVRSRIEDLIEQLIDDFLTRSSLTDAGEQRRYPRIACGCEASVHLAPGEPPASASIVNLSAGGCLIILQDPVILPQGMRVELTFQINQAPFHLPGLVKVIRSETRIGIQFSDLNESVRRQLEAHVEALIKNLVKRFAQSAAAC